VIPAPAIQSNDFAHRRRSIKHVTEIILMSVRLPRFVPADLLWSGPSLGII
jgi:hypothetical protein